MSIKALQTHSKQYEDQTQEKNASAASQLKDMQDYEAKVLDKFVTAHDASLEARAERSQQHLLHEEEKLANEKKVHEEEMAQRKLAHALTQEQELEALRIQQKVHKEELKVLDQHLEEKKKQNSGKLEELKKNNDQIFQQNEARRQKELEELQKRLEKQKAVPDENQTCPIC